MGFITVLLHFLNNRPFEQQNFWLFTKTSPHDNSVITNSSNYYHSFHVSGHIGVMDRWLYWLVGAKQNKLISPWNQYDPTHELYLFWVDDANMGTNGLGGTVRLSYMLHAISILFFVCWAMVNIILILSIQFILGVFHSGYIKQMISHLGKDFPQKPLSHGSLQQHVEGLMFW